MLLFAFITIWSVICCVVVFNQFWSVTYFTRVPNISFLSFCSGRKVSDSQCHLWLRVDSSARIHIRSHPALYFTTFLVSYFVSAPLIKKKLFLRSFEKASHKSVLGFVESLLGLFSAFWMETDFISFTFKCFCANY